LVSKGVMQAQWSFRLPAILALLATQGGLLASQVGDPPQLRICLFASALQRSMDLAVFPHACLSWQQPKPETLFPHACLSWQQPKP